MRFWRLIAADCIIDIPLAVSPPCEALSALPVPICIMFCKEATWLKVEGSVVPISKGIIASLGEPFVSTVLPGLTSNLIPRGKRVASAAIIGVVVNAKESILALISASKAFCGL